MVVSGSATFWSVPACSVPGGENPTKCTGPSKNLSGPYNWTIEGSRKPSPQVLRMVNCSSNVCQRTPTFGTAAFVSLFNHSSYRTPAVNSREYNPGMLNLGLKIGKSASA